MSAENGNGSLYSRVLNRDGSIALIAVMLLSFFIYVYWNSIQAMHASHSEQTKVLQEIKAQEVEQTDILKDIRYSLRENGGLTFRNNP